MSVTAFIWLARRATFARAPASTQLAQVTDEIHHQATKSPNSISGSRLATRLAHKSERSPSPYAPQPHATLPLRSKGYAGSGKIFRRTPKSIRATSYPTAPHQSEHHPKRYGPDWMEIHWQVRNPDYRKTVSSAKTNASTLISWSVPSPPLPRNSTKTKPSRISIA